MMEPTHGRGSLEPRSPVREPALALAMPTFAREGEVWRIAWRGAAALFRDAKGFRILATLVARPNCAVSALDLDGGSAAHTPDVATDSARERLRSLRADLDDARADRDLARAERLAAELDALVQRLLGDHDVSARAERARVNVQRRVKDALARIAVSMPALAHHLARHVRTGAACTYDPPPGP